MTKLIAEERTESPSQSVSARVSPRAARAGLALDVFLIGLIAIGVSFRFSWINWSQDTDLHPDEYGLTGTLTRLSVPTSLGEYFNTRLSPLSPYQKYDEFGLATDPGPDNRMRWGQWPITLIRVTAEVTGNSGYGPMRLLGRGMSALADAFSLLLLFLIGSRLYGPRVGLMAAALSALAVMQIQQSHFMTADNFGVLFTMLAMYCALRVAQSFSPRAHQGGSGWRWYALFGVAFGMALSSRINLLPLFGMIFVAALAAGAELWAKGTRTGLQILASAIVGLAISGLAAGLTFRVTQPMSFRAETGDTSFFALHPNPDWVESMKVAQNESSGIGGGPPGEQWTNRPAILFPLVNIVLWGMGLPLGLMAWAGLLWALWRTFRDEERRAHLLPLIWTGGYFLFMGTRWVKSIRYFLPIYPFLALFAAWAVVELWNVGRKNKALKETTEPEEVVPRTSSFVSPVSLVSLFLGAVVLLGSLAWSWAFVSAIYRTENTRIQASRWIYQNVPAPFNLHLDTVGGPYTEPLPVPSGTQVSADEAFRTQFEARFGGTTAGFTVAHARNPYDAQMPGLLRVVLAADPDGSQPLALADVRVEPGSRDPRGGSFTARFNSVRLEKGKTYYLIVTAPEGGPLEIAGSTLANENWDEGLPLRLDGRDGFGGLYTGRSMEVRWGDDENKRQMFLDNLAQVDYIILPSQRGIWSTARLPAAYPMTLEYYRALFDGRLGFELAAQFQSPLRLGPLQISDVGGTAAWGRAPGLPLFNDSLLAAEEAFSVYDHAPVWIFRKRADFDLEKARAVLNAIDLTTVVNLGPVEATKAPTLLRLPPDRLAEQRAGGTWSEMFDADGLLNRVEPLGVIAWWLALVLLGWVAFPLTSLAFGGLPDRGYPLAKTVALLVVAWLVWMAGSLRLLPFTRLTILLGCIVLAVVSGLIFWLRRAELLAYLRAHKRHILAVEGVTLALFVFALLIRYGNPDLWHPFYGGEKPMVFSFFNAVLKSTSFPPYNPWLSGYYLNYYYYGFVLVGVLVKLLGIVPAFAYNLVLPTLFALTGINAFCAAYALVEAGKRKKEAREREGETLIFVASVPGSAAANLESAAPLPAVPSAPLPLRSPASSSLRLPSPYVAGLAAALLIVVLGNLAQPRVIAYSLQKASDHPPQVFSDFNLGAVLQGAGRVLSGQTHMPIGTGDWYWTATRIIPTLNNGGGEITEFPFFTFLYADLHAHMMDLPFTLLALAWAVSYLRRRQQRGESARPLAIIEVVAVFSVGGLALGVTGPTNTWDFPTFLALGAAAVVAAEWGRDPRLSRAKLFEIGWRLALLTGLALFLYRPFSHWFAGAYSTLKLWNDTTTPLEAYFYIHGLFLFILATFLISETRRWLAETPAAVLSRWRGWLPWIGLVLLGVIAMVAGFLYLKAVVALVAVPLMAWAGLLLLRSRAVVPIEKRTVLFLLGTALAITLFVEVFALEGDRMNTIFKFYVQVWALLSVAGGAGLAWVLAEIRFWSPAWRRSWAGALAVLAGAAALYTVTAAEAKTADRFPPYTAAPESGCQQIPGMPIPPTYAGDSSWPVREQPHSLNGMDYMQWSAFCDRNYFLPLAYDYAAIRWMQDHVPGSPVIVEAQSFDLYRLSSRYTWNTGLPDVVGWDWHTRQHNAAIPTEFVTQRGNEVIAFYETVDPQVARAFLKKYDVRYVVVGPMERAYYSPAGLAKFAAMAAQGILGEVYRNPGVVIYEVAAN